jgi:predicted phage tail protein
MKTIYFHGYLREKFGKSMKFDVENPAMALSALRSQLPGWREAVRDGKFVVIRGAFEDGYSIDQNEFGMKFGRTRSLHIVPYIEGAGGKAGMVVKIVLGVVLIAAAVFTAGASLVAGAAIIGPSLGIGGALATAVPGTFGLISAGTALLIGIGLAVTGTTGLLTPKANLTGLDYQDRGPSDERNSFLFNGPVNNGTQGVPVPLVYGRMRVGSVVVSNGLATEAVN